MAKKRKILYSLIFVISALVLVLFVSCVKNDFDPNGKASASPAETDGVTPDGTDTPVPCYTPTEMPAETPEQTFTPSPTATETPTVVPTETPTQVPTKAPTPTPQPTPVPMQTILNSLGNVKWESAKNVILFIGDGMGQNHIPATDSATGGRYNGKLAIEYMPTHISVNTLTADVGNGEPDSASGGTALSTGYRSLRKLVGLDKNQNKVKNLCELCKELGKSSGVITTQTVFDATPATFTSHVASRHDTNAIINEQMTTCPANLIIGGGASTYQTFMSSPANLKSPATATWTKSWNDVQKFNGNGRLVATLTDNYWDNIKNMKNPTLAEMTKTSIDILSKNENGFFLMVEAGAMDEATHNADLAETVYSMISFDEAVEVAIRYAYEHKDTIVIVTADHNTGDIRTKAEADSIISQNKNSDPYIGNEQWCLTNAGLHCVLEAEKIAKQNHPEFDFDGASYRFTTIKHVNNNVDMFAIGYGVSDTVKGNDWASYKIGKYIGKMLSGKEFGE